MRCPTCASPDTGDAGAATYKDLVCKMCGTLFDHDEALAAPIGVIELFTADVALRVLRRQRHNEDVQAAHCHADQALVNFIKHLGYNDVADEFERVEKWYA